MRARWSQYPLLSLSLSLDESEVIEDEDAPTATGRSYKMYAIVLVATRDRTVRTHAGWAGKAQHVTTSAHEQLAELLNASDSHQLSGVTTT